MPIFKFRRFWRRRKNQAEGIREHAGEQFERNFLGRLNKFKLVRRFMLGWLLLFILIGGCVIAQINALRDYYQNLAPVPGGIYSVGIEGSFTTANPLYAVSEVDTSVSRLLFASLLTYDSHNQLAGDLADKWSVDDSGTVYTVHLRPNLTWQDGQPLTADDIVFTYKTIQDPDANSPLMQSWQGVKVASLDKSTVAFTLPNPLSSFPYSLTNGIVPKHILGSLNVVDLRSASFNTANPIGAGPFRWGSLGVGGADQNTAEEEISLLPFKQYWTGAPKLSELNIHAYSNRDTMIKAYLDKTVTALVGLDSVPTNIAKDSSAQLYNLPLTAAVMVFFKTTNPILQDPKVRQALVAGANRSAIINALGYRAISVSEPLLYGQLGYDSKFAQQTNQINQAKSLLDAAGWQVGANGMRSKDGQTLTFTLYATNSPEYTLVAKLLQSQWKAIGADVRVQLQQPADFQGTLSEHAYDAVLYGISIGVDPDVFVYWDSSQADIRSINRLNFSEYKSVVADEALEAGRTRLNEQLRIIKYRAFLQAWQQDAPALGLYQPRFLLISHTPIYGLETTQINTDADRYNNIQDWMIHTGWVTNNKP